jgi:hypothetical protein
LGVAGIGGNGGSGIVVVRYITSAYTFDGTGGAITHAGGYTYHAFTSSGIFTPPILAGANAAVSISQGFGVL